MIRLLKSLEDDGLIEKAVRQRYTQRLLDRDVAVAGLIEVFASDAVRGARRAVAKTQNRFDERPFVNRINSPKS